MHFLAYFQKIGCGAESLVKLGSLLWESSENKFGRPKKRSTKFFRKYDPPPQRPPPPIPHQPRQLPRSAPA